MGDGRSVRRRNFLAAGGALLLAGCTRSAGAPVATAPGPSPTAAPSAQPTTAQPAPGPTSSAPPTEGTVAEVLARSNVPVLCFHQLREFSADDSAYARTLITPPDVFRDQLLAIRDAGWAPVRAPDVVDHLRFGTPLPERALLLGFDDGSATHATVALPTLSELGFPAIFFPMTVVLDKPGWLSRDQVRQLEPAGMTIGAHTWDHQRLDRVSGDQWRQQLDQPAAELDE